MHVIVHSTGTPMTGKREAITAELMDVLKSVRGAKAPPPTLDMHLINDLHLPSDDATEVCLMMQDRTGIKPPTKEWSKVGTVGEVIDLLLKHAPQN
jgi:acyl carrier protein